MLKRRFLFCVGAAMLLGRLAAGEYADVIQEAETKIRSQYSGLACEAELSRLKEILAGHEPEENKIRQIRERFLKGSAPAKSPADKNASIQQLREAAEQGNDQAQYKLGCCYASGEGVKKDMEQSVFWLRKAAEQGNDEAKYALGRCYEFGRGVQKDMKQAAFWLQRAAEQGNAKAQYILGNCYASGKGVEKNLKQSVFWLRKAAEQGHEGAKQFLRDLKQ